MKYRNLNMEWVLLFTLKLEGVMLFTEKYFIEMVVSGLVMALINYSAYVAWKNGKLISPTQRKYWIPYTPNRLLYILKDDWSNVKATSDVVWSYIRPLVICVGFILVATGIGFGMILSWTMFNNSFLVGLAAIKILLF
ncbi:hypothetical protein OAB94_02415 [Flavobacteriaceae bacterium]|nr:hypothetical protein [Flavobacteriaceae bacterium]